MSFLSNYDPRVIKKNWGTLRNNPYASLKFQYWITNAIIIAVGAFICWTIINIIIKYDGGSSIMTMVTRLILFVIMVIIALKLWATRLPLKKALEHYEKSPVTKKSNPQAINVKQEIDEILEGIEKRSKLKNEA